MNKLSELNSYSNQGVLYTDPRSFEIVFSDETPDNTTDVCDEGDTPAVVIQTQITELYSSFNSNTFSVDVSACAGATVTWANSTGMNITSDSGVFTIDNIYSVARWQQARAATINLPRDYEGTFTYTATITYYDTISTTQSLSWSVVLTVNDLAEMYYPGNHTYDEDVAAVITNAPYILDLENDGSGPYIVTVVPDTLAAVTTLSSAGTGGSSVFDNETKTLTITGNRTQVNSHLASITLNPGADYADNFDMIYTQVNPVSDLVTIANQLMLIGITNEELINMELTRFYHVNAADLIFTTQLPTILEAGTFTIRFILNTTGGFISHSSDASGWTAGTLTYEFTGTQAQCNEKFTQLRFWPDEDIDTNYTVTYRQIENGIEQAVNTFSLNHLTAYDQFTGGLTQTVLEDQQDAVLDLTDISPYWNSTVSMQVSLRVTATGAVASTSTVGTISGAGWTQNSPNILTKSLTVVDSSNFDYWDDLELDLITDWDDDIFVRQAITIDSVLVATRDLAITITPKTDSIGTFQLNYNSYIADDISSFTNTINTGTGHPSGDPTNTQPFRLGDCVAVVDDLVLAGDDTNLKPSTYWPGRGLWSNTLTGIASGSPWSVTTIDYGNIHDVVGVKAGGTQHYLVAGGYLRGLEIYVVYRSNDGATWTPVVLPDLYDTGFGGSPFEREQFAIGVIRTASGTGGYTAGVDETFIGGYDGYIARAAGTAWSTGSWTRINGAAFSPVDLRLVQSANSDRQPCVIGIAGYRSTSGLNHVVALANDYSRSTGALTGAHVCQYIRAEGRFRRISAGLPSSSTQIRFAKLRFAPPNTAYTQGIWAAIVENDNGQWGVYVSTNEGNSWVRRYSSFVGIFDIVWNGRGWTILENDKITLSRDPIAFDWTSRSVSAGFYKGLAITDDQSLEAIPGSDNIMAVGGSETTARTIISNDTDYNWTIPASGAYAEKTVAVTVPFLSNATVAVTEIANDLQAENDQGWTVTALPANRRVLLDMNNNTHTVYTQSLANAGDSVNADVGVVHTFTNSTTPH